MEDSRNTHKGRLTQDRVLGETMMHMVPSCSPQPPTFDASELDFDLNLLPSDFQVPSPTSYFSPLELPVSPTMFSEQGKEKHSWYSPPHSPYSPGRRGERSLSCQSGAAGGLLESDPTGINLQESLLEFTALQDKIKQEQEQDQEQELFLDPTLTLEQHNFSLSSPSPSAHNYPLSPQNFPLSPHNLHSYPLSASTLQSSNPIPSPVPDSSQALLGIKMEPMDFLSQSSRTIIKNLFKTSCTKTSNAHGQSHISEPLCHILDKSTPTLTTSSSDTLLKQCLSDTSFQQKYNLKPFDFGGFGLGFVSKESTKISPCKTEPALSTGKQTIDEVKMKPVVDFAAVKVKKETTCEGQDIETTCEMLSISSDPRDWTTEDVRSWLFWTVQQFCIPMSQMLNVDLWHMDGQALVQLKEQDFKERLPQGGDTMYEQFDIWRGSAGIVRPMELPSTILQKVPSHAPPPYEETNKPTTENYMDIAYMLQMLDSHHNPVGAPQTHYITPKIEPGPSHSGSPPPYPGQDHISEVGTPSAFGIDPIEDEDIEVSDDEDTGKCSPSPTRPGTNIHLWQFIKELLLQPNLYGNFIHWIDRQKGIFKIVDSVKVASLWGKRKNRPAMNYDKLSRSLRQYYKKGIMKKTERSQRLVYQFCHPYHL